MYHSVIIRVDDTFINTYDAWHLIPSSRPVISPPIERTKFVTVGGRSGNLDYSQSLTHKPVFDNRTGKIEFYVENDWWTDWEIAYTTITEALQGKRVELALEDNPLHYYKGLLWVNGWKSQKGNSTITLEYNLQPKMESRPVTQLILNRTSVTLEKGMSFTLLVGVVPADTFYRKMTVNAIPSGIVEIGADGRITAKKNGSCAIRAELGGLTAECAVRVQNYGVCRVTNNLVNCRNQNLDEAVLEESAYTATIVPNTEYDMTSVTVTMGDTDITASAVIIAEDKLSATVNIEHVTGAVVITASAVQGVWYDATYELTNVTLDNAPKRVRAGYPLTLTATASSGMYLHQAKVTMNGGDISDEACSYTDLSNLKVNTTVAGPVSIKMEAMKEPTLNDFSWKAIDWISVHGQSANWFKVGDTKNIHVAGTIQGRRYDADLEIVVLGINHNTRYEIGPTIHFGCGRVNGKWASLGVYRFSNDGEVGWEKSYIRNTVLGNESTPQGPAEGSYLSVLPADLRAVMRACKKSTYNVFGISPTEDYLWLVSEYELNGSRRYAYETEKDNQSQYAFFRSGSKYCGNISALDTNIAQWTRSRYYNNSGYFCCCNADTGRGNNLGTSHSYGMIVCFGV